jgi:hypothetical protein
MIACHDTAVTNGQEGIMECTTAAANPAEFAPIIPRVDAIEADLERAEAEADLRRMLRLALRRREKAQHLGVGGCREDA